MDRVLVIGCPGAGKSYFSRRLAEKTGLPLIPLDSLYHQKIWDEDKDKKRAQWREKVSEIVKRDKWIIDGNYKGTFDIRMPIADTIIFLDYPRWLTLARAFKRRFEYRNKKRPDMPEGWKEKLDFEFFKFMWGYAKVERPKVRQLLEEYAEGKSIYILRSPAEADKLLHILMP